MIKVKDIAKVIEDFAPRNLQESYDNTGLQVGDPDMVVTAALICLDVTEDVLTEAMERECNLIISHHPLIFHGIKNLTGETPVQKMIVDAIKRGLAIYSAHTNLDSTRDGVSHEIAHRLDVRDIEVLESQPLNPGFGLGVIGTVKPTPKIEFLRKIKDTFNVRALRYSAQSSSLVIRKVAICGGSGASLIKEAIRRKADIIVTGDVKYHDFTTFGNDILIADIGHYESELCARDILSRTIRDKYPDFTTYFSDTESNPIKIL
ncbi:MAG: Nif3-like dinuclear metal center hexameric protein [Muribaculaceae bacterium]|nr:Nif3-like dinuclear metal center hexameric protein [Muribaculaceae bacterium]